MIKSVVTSLVIAAAVAAWVLSGQFGEEKAGAAIDNAAPAFGAAITNDPVHVRVRELVTAERTREVVLRGRTEAMRRVAVRAETSGRVVEVLVERGDAVRAGDVLVRIAMEDREAKLAEAIARVRQREIEYAAARQLNERGYRSRNKMAESAAELDKAAAYQAQIELDISHTEVLAPFAGVLDERPAEIGDVLSKGSVVADIVDRDPFLVVGQVSERDVHRIKLDDWGRAELVNGATVEGAVSFISTTADPQTRTFRVELKVPNGDGALRDGLTSKIRIPVDRQSAHVVSSAVLTLNDAGVLGVRTVGDDLIVRFMAVDIIDDNEDGIWLTGLPASVRVITVGQEFVRDGDRVRVTVQNTQ
jgi:multidrug efflux system membrane fusion protein